MKQFFKKYYVDFKHSYFKFPTEKSIAHLTQLYLSTK